MTDNINGPQFHSKDFYVYKINIYSAFEKSACQVKY